VPEVSGEADNKSHILKCGFCHITNSDYRFLNTTISASAPFLPYSLTRM